MKEIGSPSSASAQTPELKPAGGCIVNVNEFGLPPQEPYITAEKEGHIASLPKLATLPALP